MSDESEIVKAWVDSETEKLRTLKNTYSEKQAYLPQSKEDSAYFGALIHAQITPFYDHFRAAYIEREEDDIIKRDLKMNGGKGGAAPSNTFGRESPGPAPQGGKSAGRVCTKCDKPFTPKTERAILCYDCWRKANPRRH